jgi:hypothetical protein
MGNWGNTLDRWYHRAVYQAPRPPRRHSRRSGTAVRGRTPEESGRTSVLFGTTLLAADAVADASTAAMLLHPFRVENLTDAPVTSFAKIAGGYGHQWTADLLRTWFGGDQPAWAYGGARNDRSGWRTFC